MKLYYVVNARVPNDKAHGIQIARMTEAFRAVPLTLSVISPKRRAGGLYARGKWGFLISSFFFILWSALFLIGRRIRGEHFVIYTIDMDTFSYTLLPLIAATFAEMHSPKPNTFLNRLFFAHVSGVIATTRATKEALAETFTIPHERITVEPNGVRVADYRRMNKQEARKQLLLPQEKKIVLYVGRVYAWKGLGIFSQAIGELSEIVGYFVGGTEDELVKLTGEPLPKNLMCVGVRPHEEIPLWLAGADALLVIGTLGNEDSMRYTSPMKVFEYLAAGRPIVASRTPALTEVLDTVDWYEPDNVSSLKKAIQKAVQEEPQPHKASHYDWQERAARIVHFMIEHGGNLD